ncbi:MAG: hypothetical protein PF482_06540, partial [Desulfobacteraceae bacterium]|nr:hypothetical protein [Desulfobacteraceae bacterium]
MNGKSPNCTFFVIASHAAGVAGTATTEAISLSTGDYYRSFLTPRNDNHDFEVFVPALFMSTIVQNG